MSPRSIIRSALCGVLIPAATALARAAAQDVIIADFEGPDYGRWKAEGEAFAAGPARGTLPGQMHVDGFAGKGLVNSFSGGDRSTGKLTSPEFVVDRDYVSFLVGGGGHEGETCLNLRVDGKVARTATGPNTSPGGSERLEPQSWDVRDLRGKTARIEIIDTATGGWGHINVDQIVLTDAKPATLLRNAQREIVLEKTFLNLPVKTGAKKRRVSVSVEGKKVRDFEIELADAAPDFWVFTDMSAWRGKTAVIAVNALLESSGALASVEQSDAIKGAENLYREPLRPQFHFSSRRGWLNDPNGLVWHAGEYHLYYQHNPYGWDWGNMHWGHAVSTDLVHWRELPIAIYPRAFGDWAFSGSAVVDRENTSGWKAGAEDVLVAAYTSTGRGECIVYSNDRGRTWTEFEGNPVVKHSGRDPRLLWHAPTKRWVMALYTEAEKKQWIAFYTSADLKTWKYESRIEGFYECPDLFELPVDGDPKNRKWVLTAASSEYMVGSFDGRQFTPETPKLPGHRGGDGFYAAQTFSAMPEGDTRVVQIGWGRMPSPGMPFNQLMCAPCELTLRTTKDGVRLAWEPVRELAALRTGTHRVAPQPLRPGANPLAKFDGELLDISAELTVGEAKEIGFRIRGVPVSYDAEKRELVVNKKRTPWALDSGKLSLRILVDHTSFEVFADQGHLFMAVPVPGPNGRGSIDVFAKGGDGAIDKLEVHLLRSIWPK